METLRLLPNGSFTPLSMELYKTFNQVCNSIEARYGENQPHGGVIYKHPVHGMLLDSYGRGNIHNSVFQWHPHDFKKGSLNWNRPTPFPSDLRKVFKAIYKNRNKNRVMVLGHKSDPFMWMDCRYNQTKKIIKYATKYGVALSINTMSDLCAHDDYLKLIKDGNHQVVMNMSSLNSNEEIERILSPGAPSLARRRKAVSKLSTSGIEVYIRVQPIPATKVVSRRLGISIKEIKKLNKLGAS